MLFSSTARQLQDRVVLTVSGDVDLATHARFQADIDQAWDGSTDLVIDCSQVTFLDSMGLRVLVQTVQRAAEHDRSVALAAPSDAVAHILELSGIRDLFTEVGPVPDSEPEANPGHRS